MSRPTRTGRPSRPSITSGAAGGPPRSGRGSRPEINTGPPSRRRLRRLARLSRLDRLPGAIPDKIEKIEEGIERGLAGAAGVLRDPVGAAQKVIHQLQAPRGLVMGWAIAMILPILLYLIDLGSGSLWQGDDAVWANALLRLSSGQTDFLTALGELPRPMASPLGLLQMVASLRLLGPSELTLRLVPVFSALLCAICLLAIAIDIGLGRHVGGLAGLVFLALPVTYQLAHRVVPDLLLAVASTSAVAVVSHALHGHKFDRHILPIHKAADEPAPLPLRRLPMFFGSLSIGAAAAVDPRAAILAMSVALLDMLVAHRYLFRKRRVWLMLLGGSILTAIAVVKHPQGLPGLFKLHGREVALRQFWALWYQGPSWYGRHAGAVVIVMTGFGLFLGSMRRASRTLLCWVAVAGVLSALSDPLPAPRGIGLLLPPLALAAAVGLQSPVRWLGSIGGLVTLGALSGVVVGMIEGDGVLHKSDSIKQLALSQQHAPAGAKLCSLAIPPPLVAYYARISGFGGPPIEEFPSVTALKAALKPGQPFACLMPLSMVPQMQQAFSAAASVVPPVQPRISESLPVDKRPSDGKRTDARSGRPTGKPTAPREPSAPDPTLSVLATTIDIEEPPRDIPGPKVALISR